ncbi:uncharacterized protein LOC133337163, partial [Musca vetustissima]|uniref:uncharacterized protein LOC133337163 n=1 Tax=Musca vetustissima TaxID=27455 RepID=UPI002AB65F86
KRSNDLTNFETTNLLPPQHQQQYIAPAYHQLPADLSAENIQKEAALVLAQAKRHKSIAENGDNIPTFRVKTKRSGGDSSSANPKKFHSLPSRKKKPPSKPVSRSNSDAAGKKPPKRPSIFSLFSRKSDTNINQGERDPRFEDSGGRRLVRSKSDVGSSSYKLKKVLKEPKSALSAGSNKHLPTQLSPIIENDSKEDYFEEDFTKHTRERRKSEAITDKEKHESAINELLGRSHSQAEVDGGGLVGRIPVSDVIKEKILSLQAKSQENMHSSQLPAQKLPLTKGHTVNGMVKRLSMERFSPPPTITGPAFSYIRPNEGITYAQLELQDEPQSRSTLPRREYTRSPVREYRSPVREMRSPSRDIFTPDRELVSTTVVNRSSLNKSEDQTDFIGTSQRNNYSPSYNTNNGTTTIHIGGSFSPSPWQMLSPRNLSDEDEGLGLETRKYYDEDLTQTKRCKSPAEPPIVPKIRSITPPRENGYHATDRYHTPNRDVNPNDDMGYRRARLESRILTRRFRDSGTLERNGYSRENSHERVLDERDRDYHTKRYLSPEREIPRDSHEPMRYHKPEVKEILNKYSPERSHLDIISPSTAAPTTATTMEKTSRYKHTKYYDDGHGGVKEVYERETQFDPDGKPHVRETRHRERLDSSLMERQLITDYEPKSFDSQFTTTDQYRSSPENMKRYDLNSDRGVNTGRLSSEDRWHSSLKRDKLQQRSFDKGDSGIENDFRKESFNGDLVTRWRKPTPDESIQSCESFLKKERRYCEHERQPRRSENYVYRERSIDDGSHFDPHLDKYPQSSATLKRRDQQSQTNLLDQEKTSTSTLKRSKKLGGFEKVKQLFTGG